MSENERPVGELTSLDDAHELVAGHSGQSPRAAQECRAPEAALAPVSAATLESPPDFRAGTAALAAMPDDEFEVRLIAMRRGRERITRIHRELMDPETDYGVIPGTKQPTLLKPGAEKLCDFYRLAAEFHPEINYGDGEQSPPITVVTECRLHLGTLDGPVVNTGHGAANSWEKLGYRYRRGERSCPACGKIGTIIKGRAEFGGGWLCFAKKGGCGAKYADEAPEIVDQPVGDIENPDPYDLLNTLLKIAEKRAYVDAVLRATATSGLYTQDVEETTERAADPPRQDQPVDSGEPAPPAIPISVDLPGIRPPSLRSSPASAVPSVPSEPALGHTIDVSARVTPQPATLKAAYQEFLTAMQAAGFDRNDNETAKQLMLAGAGRASRRGEPYTVEEFLRVAEALRRRAAPGRRAA